MNAISINNVIEIEINEFPNISESQLKVQVPSPGAYIFHRGMVFVRRSSRLKKAKDLYYIFDILANCSELKEQIVNDFKLLKTKYYQWFKRFIKNIKLYFSDITSDGVALVFSQRQSGIISDLTDDQFKQYIFNTFKELLNILENIINN